MKKVRSKMLCFVLSALLLFGILPGNGPDGILAADNPTGITVEKVEFNGDTAYDDFVRGVDISTYDALYQSGVRFYDYNGEKMEDYGGFFKILKESGVNWVRIRIWNHPYNDDAKTQGYGAGNVDVERAIKMGKAATDAGLRVLADFHYSDFWADPGKSRAPKAWQHYLDEGDLAGLAAELKTYTKDSLESMRAQGVDVGMVQIGNETNNAISGVWAEQEQDGVVVVDRTEMCRLFQAGCEAVRSVDGNILIALHFADPHEVGYQLGWAADLQANNVDYDVFASSYYPYWHGSLDNLKNILSEIANTYHKKVMVAETSWAYTEEDGDGTDEHKNVVPERGDLSAYGGASVQAQANELRDVIDTIAHTTNGIGVFYWEPAWIPAYTSLEGYANSNADALNLNKELWETYGTGWASTHLGGYADPGEFIDPEDRISGSEWDNQALFTFDGKPLESLKTWLYVKAGAAEEPGTNDIDKDVATGTGAPAVVLVEEAADILERIELTADEKAAVENGTEIVIALLEELITEPDPEEKAKIKAALAGYDEGIYLDYKLSLTVGEAQPRNVSELSAPITITVTIPETLRNPDTSVERSYRMITIHNGEASVIDGQVDAANNTFTFKTAGFSTYALVYKDPPKPTTKPDGDNKPNPVNPPKPTEGAGTGDKTNPVNLQKQSEAPKTGDTNNTPVVGGILLSGFVMAGSAWLVILRRRRTRL